MPPTTVKGIRSILWHAEFYKRFIQNFSKIVRLVCRLLEKDAKFEFDEACSSAFEDIKARLVIVPSWIHHTRVKIFKLRVMSVTMQWE